MDCSIRTSADQCLLAAPRSFSQLATSFFGSQCQGIHLKLFVAWPCVLMVLSVNCSCYPKNYFLGFYLNFAVFIVQFSRYKEHKMYNILCSPNWTSFSLLFVRFLFFLLTESIKETFGQLALLVGSSGLEPPTLRLSGVRSNHLSYEPIKLHLISIKWTLPN